MHNDLKKLKYLQFSRRPLAPSKAMQYHFLLLIVLDFKKACFSLVNSVILSKWSHVNQTHSLIGYTLLSLFPRSLDSIFALGVEIVTKSANLILIFKKKVSPCFKLFIYSLSSPYFTIIPMLVVAKLIIPVTCVIEFLICFLYSYPVFRTISTPNVWCHSYPIFKSIPTSLGGVLKTLHCRPLFSSIVDNSRKNTGPALLQF